MFLIWSPDVLNCQIYENGFLVDLNTLHEVVLGELIDAIYPLWRTSPESSIWYGVQVYEKKSLFKPSSVSIEIEAYVRDVYRMSGKRQISIHKLNLDSKIGRKFQIEPKNTMLKRWSGPVEVAFVA
jgi:hypothetical protein